MNNNKYIYIVVIIGILLLLAIPAFIFFRYSLVTPKSIVIDKDDSNTIVMTFDECIELEDSVIQESYPRRCVLPDGTTLIEEIEEEEKKEDDKEEDKGVEEAKSVKLYMYVFDINKYNTPDNSEYLTKVNRETTRKDVATYILEEMIKGPNSSEKAIGLESTFGTGKQIWFTSTSNCNGKDFKIEIKNKIATVQFCRDTKVVGDISSAIVTDQIMGSLKQFSTIDKVRVLDSKGNCLNEMAGLSASECVF